MIAWMLNHIRTTIVIISALVTGLILPALLWSFNFVMDLRQSQANDKVQDNRIYKLEAVSYKLDGRFETIQESLIRLENDRYEELKKARQQRLSKP